jgi:hypothetical protein
MADPVWSLTAMNAAQIIKSFTLWELVKGHALT